MDGFSGKNPDLSENPAFNEVSSTFAPIIMNNRNIGLTTQLPA